MKITVTNLTEAPYSFDMDPESGFSIRELIPVRGSIDIGDRIDPYTLQANREVRAAVDAGDIRITLTGESGDIVPAPGAVRGTSLVYMPSAPADRILANVYTDWSALYSDYQELEGTVIISYDDTYGTCTIPPGDYIFNDATTHAGRLGTIIQPSFIPDYTNVVWAEGAHILPNADNRVVLHLTDALLFKTTATSTPTITLGGASMFAVLERGSGMQSDGTQPFLYHDSTVLEGGVIIAFREGGFLSTGASPCIYLDAPGPTAVICVLTLFDEGSIQSDTIGSDTAGILVSRVVSTSSAFTGQFSLTQSTFLSATPINATLEVHEVPMYAVTSVASSGVSANQGELIQCDPSGGGFSVALPSCAGRPKGTSLIIKNVTSSTNTISIDPNGGDTIDGTGGAGALTITSAYGVAKLVNDGASNWLVI